MQKVLGGLEDVEVYVLVKVQRSRCVPPERRKASEALHNQFEV